MTNKEILYNSKLAVLAYQTPDSIQWKDYKLSLIKWIEHKPSDTQGFVAIKNRTIYVVFRGSESKKDFQNDGSVSKVPFIEEGEKVHIGFKSCWEPVEEDVYSGIRTANEMMDTVDSVVVCGHSLGGAVATLMAYSIKNRFYGYHVECCTIGSPRVGNKVFKQNFDKSGIESIRVVHNNDLVTHTPYIGFLHVNHQLRLDSDGNVKKGENTLGYLWDYLKSLFSGETIKDHMCENYMNAIDKWVNK
jgi:predicted lipase